MALEVYATTDQNMGLREVARHARCVEALGYDGLLVPDGVHDGLLVAQAALQASERLRVVTAVVVAFARSPMVVAQAAWDLQASSGGRFELGLGTQVRGNIVGRYSGTWRPPVARMKEYVESLRSIWHAFQEGGELDYTGEHYRFTRLQPFFNPGPIEHPNIPVLLGGVGPKMTRLAGSIADGLVTHPTNSSPRFLDEVALPLLSLGAGGTRPYPPGVIAAPLVAMGANDQQVAGERERLRGLLAFLYSTPAYWPTLELCGMAELGRRLRRLTRERAWQDMTAQIPDALLDEVLPSAVYEEIGALLRDRYAHRARGVTLPLPPLQEQDRVPSILAAIRE